MKRVFSASTSTSSDRDRVLDATDLVALIGEHVALRPKGREWVGLCPFHDDRSPSLCVIVHKADRFYKCFACGAAGNAIDFVMNFLRMDFLGALRFLAQRAGVTLSEAPRRAPGGVDREALLAANAAALRHWRGLLTTARAGRSSNRAAVAGARVVEERGISDAMAEQFQLGCATDSWDDLTTLVKTRELELPAFVAAGLIKVRSEGGGHFDMFRNRVIFPINDEIGRPIAFGARRIDPEDNPKYLNSPESDLFHKSRTLYGLDLAKRPIIDRSMAIITEGYTDVIACHQHGFRNVVATLGTALTVEHARVLRRLCDRIVLLFDGDEAGRKAADRAAEVFFAEPVDVSVCVLPGGRDPDELLREQDGPARFGESIQRGVDVLDYLVDRFMEQYRTAETLSGRQQRIEGFLARLVELGLDHAGDLRRRFVLDRLSSLLGMPVNLLESSMPRGRRRPESRQAIAARGSVASSDGDDERGDASPGVDPEPEVVRLAPGILKAEQWLLALLLRHPELADERIDAGDGTRLPVTEALGPGRFAHPLHRSLAQALFPLLDGERSRFSMTTLFADIAQPELRDLASSLYLGEGMPRSVGAPATLLREFCDALDRAHRQGGLLDDGEASPDPQLARLDPNEASRLFKRQGQLGPNPGRIARGLRYRPSP